MSGSGLSAGQDFDRFLLQIIHDLRAPLRQSFTRTQLLERAQEGSLTAEADEHLRAVLEANSLVDRFLRRLAEYCLAGKDMDRSPRMRAPLLLDGAIHALALGSASPPVELVKKEVAEILLPEAFQKVFTELLDNALKFRSEAATIQIGCARDGPDYVFQVRDNGIGFDQRFAERILEPLQKLHGSASYSGFGLGLAICRRIVEASHGRLWAKALPGGGSSFHFSVPAG